MAVSYVKDKPFRNDKPLPRRNGEETKSYFLVFTTVSASFSMTVTTLAESIPPLP